MLQTRFKTNAFFFFGKLNKNIYVVNEEPRIILGGDFNQ